MSGSKIEGYDSKRSKQYVSSRKSNKIRQYVDPYTVLQYLGDVKDKDVLDLGCGDGHYCRLLKENGATKVVGIDISPEMINLAKNDGQLACEYHVIDAETEEKPIGQFDAVIVIFVLVYADTADRLSNFCNYIYKNLKPGGLCVSLIRNCLAREFWENSMEKYGHRFTLLDETEDGGFSCITHLIMDSGNEFKVKNNVLNSKTYEKCFLNAGFKTFEFKPVLVDKNCPIPETYWNDFLENPHQIAIVATK